MPTLEERATRLTPREHRILLLCAEGRSTMDLCTALGVSASTIESHKQSIRRKLAIPRGVRIEEFARAHMPDHLLSAGAEVSVPVPSFAEQRLRLLLRMTIGELEGVVTRARGRTRSLAAASAEMSSDVAAAEEIEHLQRLTDRLAAVYDEAVAGARGNGAADPSRAVTAEVIRRARGNG